MIIGLKGQNLNELKTGLYKYLGKEVTLDVQGVKEPDCDSRLVAKNVASQLERRVSFRRAMKRAMQLAMTMNGVGGIRIQTSGRLGGG
jgi:small subunit ribosomal protein S3